LTNQFASQLARESFDKIDAKIEGRIYLPDYYPVLIPDVANEWVFGELLTLKNAQNTFEWLDQYEDVDAINSSKSLYQRKKILVFGGENQIDSAWVYVFCQSIEGLEHIKSGDFLKL
jgi:gamma-glutamylcyclotransferase (GGCT)/AIG2-like uncharacterized protein YtfP